MTALAGDYDPETCRKTVRWDLHLPFVLPKSKCGQDDWVQHFRFPCILKLNWTDCCKGLGSTVLLFVSSFKKLLTNVSLLNTDEISQPSPAQSLQEIFAEYVLMKSMWYRSIPITCCVPSLLWNMFSLVWPRWRTGKRGISKMCVTLLCAVVSTILLQ